jgi:hypothetical protein
MGQRTFDPIAHLCANAGDSLKFQRLSNCGAVRFIHILRSKSGIAEQKETAGIAAGRM